ncbi:MAG: hypothetical protein H0X29_11875 [Parachlamydiaceae bacterium]|nr:hypothetical protein [Parachlamydiaceae bacterium]
MISASGGPEKSPLDDLLTQALDLRSSAKVELIVSSRAKDQKINALKEIIQAHKPVGNPIKNIVKAIFANKKEKKLINENSVRNAEIDGIIKKHKKEIKDIEKERKVIQKVLKNLERTSNTDIIKIRKLSLETFELIKPDPTAIEDKNSMEIQKFNDKIQNLDETYKKKITEVASKISKLNGIFTAQKTGSNLVENEQLNTEIRKITALSAKFRPLLNKDISSEALKIFDEVSESVKIHNIIAESNEKLKNFRIDLNAYKEAVNLNKKNPDQNFLYSSQIKKADRNLSKAFILLAKLEKKEQTFAKKIPTIKQVEQFEKEVKDFSSIMEKAKPKAK